MHKSYSQFENINRLLSVPPLLILIDLNFFCLIINFYFCEALK